MAGRLVYVVCAEGEESLAEQLAGPLQEAGYEVGHNGRVPIGNSTIGAAEKAIASGSPIVLCATARTVGSAWAHRIVNATHGAGSPGRVFVVKMEPQAYVEQLALGGKIADYCADPAEAIAALLAALGREFPAAVPPGKAAGPAAAGTGHQFLDQPTDLQSFDIEAVHRFRAELRREVAVRYPPDVSAWDFLARINVWADGRLTRTGALLFGKDPTASCPSAMVKCAAYHGRDRAATRETVAFEGTVQSQIIAARDFVADRAAIGERPSADQAQAAIVYAYPMIAVREVIANALVHRDYAAPDQCVHVRLFADRLEISSPGTWIGHDLNPGEQYRLSALDGPSRKRNFRLAHILSWIRLVEGEGSGIPSAIRECQEMRSPAPVVTQDPGGVTVTFLRLAGREAADGPGRPGADPGSRAGTRPSGGPDPGDSSPSGGSTRRIALWGAPGTGKTTFLAALNLAVLRSAEDVRIIGSDDESTRYLTTVTQMLTSDRTFPAATQSPRRLSWELRLPPAPAERHRGLGRLLGYSAARTPTRITLDLLDSPGRSFGAEPADPEDDLIGYLASCDGIVYLYDPVREGALGDAHEFFQGTLLRMAQRRFAGRGARDARLPQHLAVCITKFDDPRIFRLARSRGFATFGGTDLAPRVAAEDAEAFFDELCAVSGAGDTDLVAAAIRRYFRPERVRYFVTSSVGFYQPGPAFRAEDSGNVVETGDGQARIRGPVHPVNVVEPLLWLGRSLA